MGIKTVDALIRRILKAVVIQEKQKGLVAAILKRFAGLRPTFSLDPITLMPTFSFDAAVEISAQSVGKAIELIKELYGKKKIAVVMDEFQDLLDLPDAYEAMAILRSQIQYQSDIAYLFVGSIRRKMDAIFVDNDSPFFKAAIPIEVLALDDDVFKAFIEAKFKKGKRSIGKETLSKIIEIGRNVPGDVQQLCEALWACTDTQQTIEQATISDALNLIFSREISAYENYVRLITTLQFKSLLTIARQGGKNIYSIEFLKAAGFNNPSSLKRCVQRLTDLNILFGYKGEFRFVNPFFRAWILLKN